MTDMYLIPTSKCSMCCDITQGKAYPVDKFDGNSYRFKDDEEDIREVCAFQVEQGEFELIKGFSKFSLLNGDVVRMRNGNTYIYFKKYAGRKDAFVNVEGGFCEVEGYEVDLAYAKNHNYDVMEVHRPMYNSTFYFATDSLVDYECVFKREDRKKMTVEEIEAALGYKIEVVDDE